MEQKAYQIVFSGKVIKDENIENVKRNFADRWGMNEKQLEKIFSGRKVVLKSNLDYEKALKVQTKFEQAGAFCEIRPMTNPDLQTEKKSAGPIRCPKCGFEQSEGEECLKCGVVFSKFAEQEPREENQLETIDPEPSSADYPHGRLKGGQGQSTWLPAVLFIITFGFYFPFWFYKNLDNLRRLRHLSLHPISQTLCLLIPGYNLFVIYQFLKTIDTEASIEEVAVFKVKAVFLTLILPYAILISVAVLKIDGPYWLLYCISALAVAEVQKTLNALFENQPGRLPVAALSIWWKAALGVFLFAFIGLEIFIYVSNTLKMKDFADYTYNKIDSLIFSDADHQSIDIEDRFEEYVLYGRSVMNGRSIYRKNAAIVFNTVLSRLGEAHSPDIEAKYGPGGNLPKGSAAYNKQQEILKEQMALTGNRSAYEKVEIRSRLPIRTEYLVRLLTHDNKFLHKTFPEKEIAFGFSPMKALNSYRSNKNALVFQKDKSGQKPEEVQILENLAWGVECYFVRSPFTAELGDFTDKLPAILQEYGSSFNPFILPNLKSAITKKDIRLYVYDVKTRTKIGFRLITKNPEGKWRIYDSMDEAAILKLHDTENVEDFSINPE